MSKSRKDDYNWIDEEYKASKKRIQTQKEYDDWFWKNS